MKLLTRFRFVLKNIHCRIFGHRPHNVSFGTVGAEICGRCLETVKVKTIRREVTKGDMERRLAAVTPPGYSYVSFNRKSRKAKFVGKGGTLLFIPV
jgi:hypothetical protein